MGRIISGEEARRYLQENNVQEKPKSKIISGEEAKKYLEENDTEKPGYLKSAAIGAAQGATGETASDILSALQAAGSVVTRGPKGALDRYKQFKEYNRKGVEEAKKENPITYNTANLGGNVALSSAIPGGKLAQLAVPSAIQAFGESKRSLLEDPSGLAKDVYTGGTIGTASGLALGQIGELGLKGAKYLGSGIKNKFAEAAYELPKGLGSKYYKVSPNIESEQGGHEFSKELSKRLPEIGKKTSQLSTESFNALKNPTEGIVEKIEPKEISGIFDRIIGSIEKEEQGISTSDSIKNTKKILSDISDQYKNANGPVGLDRIKQEVQNIDSKIKYDRKNHIPQDERILHDVRGKLNSLLTENENYAKIIPNVSEHAQTAELAAERFGQEFKPKDVLSTVKDIAKGAKKDPVLIEEANRIGEKLGIDIKNKSEIAYIKDAIEDSDIFTFKHGYPNLFKGLVIRSIPKAYTETQSFVNKNVSRPAAEKIRNFVELYKDKTPDVVQLGISKLMDAASRGDKSSVLALQILKQFQESGE